MNRSLKPTFYFMIALIALWCSTSVEVAANEFSAKQKIALLQPIERHAMQYGEGNTKVYVFVDPKCPHSQDFMSMIFESPKMRTMYRYYIFFYELKRFDSHDLIGTIYASPSPLQRLLEVMVGKKEIVTVHEFEPSVNEKINEIERVAEEIGVSKRPYLIIVKERD